MEINETMVKIKERGDTDFTGDDFETMPYLTAVTKVRGNHSFVSQIKRDSSIACTGNFEDPPYHRRSDARTD